DHALRPRHPATARRLRFRRGGDQPERRDRRPRRHQGHADRGRGRDAPGGHGRQGHPGGGAARRRGDARPRRGGGTRPRSSRPPQRRRPGERRRRLDDRPRQGGRDDDRAADHRGADHLCRLGAPPGLGLIEGAKKTTGIDQRVLPKVIIYDAALTMSLPVEMSVASGLNALAHCVDSMWAPNADPINAAFAAEGIRSLAAGLPKVVADPMDLDGREHALYAAYLSATAFASAGSGLHHKICHVLGGKYNLPHAQTHATVLPYVLAFNGPAAPEAERRIATAFGASTGSALDGLVALKQELNAPHALADYGFREDSID